MNMLVNGIGNIGTTLANILLSFREILRIDEVYLNKNKPAKWHENDLSLLTEQGAIITTTSGSGKYREMSEVIDDVDFIFDCTEKPLNLENRKFYETLGDLRGAVAQGSARGFGIPYMSGLDSERIQGEKFVQIVSCNTHATVSILQTICGERLENLENADLVVVRRSDDIGNHRKLVGANVVARHLDPVVGTHHGCDAVELFKAIGLNPKITTSDITTPSQVMHSARFNITLRENIGLDEVIERLKLNHMISMTDKFDSNAIFELGRRYGFQGRIYSHAIVVGNNLLVSENTVKGWMFVPQEGNTVLSTIESFLLQTSTPDHSDIFDVVKANLLKSAW